MLDLGSSTQNLTPADAAIRQLLGPASAQYATLQSYSLTYPHTKTTAYFGIYRNLVTGKLAKFVFDDKGAPTSAPEMQAQDLAKKRALYGPFDPDFLATLQMAPSASYDVVIGYSSPVPPKPAVVSDPAITLAGVDAALKARRQQQAAFLAPTHIGATYPFTGSDQDRLSNQAKIYVGNTGTVSQKYAWFDANGVRLVNNSEYKNSTDAQNWYVRNEYITVTHPAGNYSVSGPKPVTCAANAVCVGSGHMVTSPEDTDHWKTDPQDNSNKYAVDEWHNYYLNGYQERSFPDVEKPDLTVMNGWDLDIGTNQWTGCAETSCAAPTVAGLVGLLQEHAPFTLLWPELVRPLLMTSAVSHNVEGAQLSLNSGSDERDGAGVPVASVLKKIIDNQWYVKGPLYPSSFDANNEYEAAMVSVPAGQGVRVVLGYLHCAPLDDYNDNEFLAVDLDLVLEVDGQLVGWSWSSNNSLESWEWTNSLGSTKTVHIIIRKYGTWQSCNGLQREYFGVAWAKHNGSYIVP